VRVRIPPTPPTATLQTRRPRHARVVDGVMSEYSGVEAPPSDCFVSYTRNDNTELFWRCRALMNVSLRRALRPAIDGIQAINVAAATVQGWATLGMGS
jgi:hypothetical protein